MQAPFLPPPSPAERVIINVTKSMTAAQVAHLLGDVCEDRELSPPERGQQSLRLLNILAEKIGKENPAPRHS